MSPRPCVLPMLVTRKVYESWCRTPGTGHSCVKVNCQLSCVLVQLKMFWTTFGS